MFLLYSVFSFIFSLPFLITRCRINDVNTRLQAAYTHTDTNTNTNTNHIAIYCTVTRQVGAFSLNLFAQGWWYFACGCDTKFALLLPLLDFMQRVYVCVSACYFSLFFFTSLLCIAHAWIIGYVSVASCVCVVVGDIVFHQGRWKSVRLLLMLICCWSRDWSTAYSRRQCPCRRGCWS